jgi:hypothetical protein
MVDTLGEDWEKRLCIEVLVLCSIHTTVRLFEGDYVWCSRPVYQRQLST